MSCFAVSPAHISALVQARSLVNRARYGGAGLCETMNDHELGQWLTRENARSVYTRYEGRHNTAPDEAWIASYRYDRGADKPRTVVELLKAVQCFEQQTNEIPDWEASDVRRFCAELFALLVPCLPGWDAAPWGID